MATTRDISREFVRVYYTLLNKKPSYIYNFYSNSSTFIHGTIEMANEHYTEPVVGREKIKKKMEEMKLNDCRAKIKQIDCLETLGNGFVIQVIGELSNNGRPMRRFLQTFVLAPSPNDSRQDGADATQNTRTSATDRRGVQLDESSNNSSSNPRYFVLNSIFRYQDDGTTYNEFEDDAAVNSSADNTNGGKNDIVSKKDSTSLKQTTGSNAHVGNTNGSASLVPEYPQGPRRRPAESAIRDTSTVDATTGRLADDLDEGLKLNKAMQENTDQIKRDAFSGSSKGVPNGMGSGADKKSESTEKTTENGKAAAEHSTTVVSSNTTGQVASSQQPAPVPTLSRPQPSNEPKTWANMVRNAHPQSTTASPIQVNKPAVIEQQQSSNQLQGNAAASQSQQSSPQQQSQNQQQHLDGANNPNNNRRRMVRKPAGRSIKNRVRKPMP